MPISILTIFEMGFLIFYTPYYKYTQEYNETK